MYFSLFPVLILTDIDVWCATSCGIALKAEVLVNYGKILNLRALIYTYTYIYFAYVVSVAYCKDFSGYPDERFCNWRHSPIGTDCV